MSDFLGPTSSILSCVLCPMVVEWFTTSILLLQQGMEVGYTMDRLPLHHRAKVRRKIGKSGKSLEPSVKGERLGRTCRRRDTTDKFCCVNHVFLFASTQLLALTAKSSQITLSFYVDIFFGIFYVCDTSSFNSFFQFWVHSVLKMSSTRPLTYNILLYSHLDIICYRWSGFYSRTDRRNSGDHPKELTLDLCVLKYRPSG